MVTDLSRTRADRRQEQSEGWLMALARRLTARQAHPPYLYPGQLSPHLLRDIGLDDTCMPPRRPRS
jgi:hypothetical protein